MLAVVLSNLLVLVTSVYRTFRGTNGAGETGRGGSTDETDSSSNNSESTSKRETDVGSEGKHTPRRDPSAHDHADEIVASILTNSTIRGGHEANIVSRTPDQHLLEHLSALYLATIALIRLF
jgi:hypothetical protein